MANEDLTPKDVDREYVSSFMITDEKSSFLLRPNLAAAFPSMPTLQYASLVGSYPSFGDSEGFPNINGKPFLPKTPPSIGIPDFPTSILHSFGQKAVRTEC